ncbi:hypothetical protein XPA_007890 [Xanthoria parietina]
MPINIKTPMARHKDQSPLLLHVRRGNNNNPSQQQPSQARFVCTVPTTAGSRGSYLMLTWPISAITIQRNSTGSPVKPWTSSSEVLKHTVSAEVCLSLPGSSIQI